MKIAEQIISKGIYQYPQIDGFLKVEHYIFLRQKGQKCLILRLKNESEFTIDGLKVNVIQIDEKNNVIKETTYQIPVFYATAGNNFNISDGFAVDDKCVDFKIEFISVHSGNYTYSVHNGKVITSYTPIIKDSEILLKIKKKKKDRFWAFSKTKKPRISTIVSAIVGSLLLIALVMLPYYLEPILQLFR